MSDANNEQLRPPQSWDRFEEICADLFARIWDDAHVVRYGRSGQTQHGVDIFGRDNGKHTGVQCKLKRDGAATRLTVVEIDAEVAKARTFVPALDNYIIVTTAENDTRSTDRANSISAEHEKSGLFRVTVYGWTEIARRLQDYPNLLKKHFSSFTLRHLEETLPDAVADRVVDRLRAANSSIGATDREEPLAKTPDALSQKIADALERDFASRYERALQRSMYPEMHKQDANLPHLPNSAAIWKSQAWRLIEYSTRSLTILLFRLRTSKTIYAAVMGSAASSTTNYADCSSFCCTRTTPTASWHLLRQRDSRPRASLAEKKSYRWRSKRLPRKVMLRQQRSCSTIASWHSTKAALRCFAPKSPKHRVPTRSPNNCACTKQLKRRNPLRSLVGALVDEKDHIGIAKYAEFLFAETADPRDLALAAKAALRAGDGDAFVRLVETYPYLKNRDADFLRSYGWQLFRLGRLREAKDVADEIERKYPDSRDLSFEFAVALDTGEWEMLAGSLTAALDRSRNLDGIALIRAANLAQASGQGSTKDLIAAALAKDGDNPHVLLGAYQLYLEQGLEEQPETFEWFRKALALSGPDGPVQSFEMKELLSKQVEWNQHTSTVSQNLMRGDLPLAVAGPGLRTTVVDIVLRNLVRNANLTDGRRRTAIPLFSGRRLPTTLNSPECVALDITSVLVLGWLGILPTVIEAFPRMVLPAGLLIELFEGRKRIRHTQRTRLQKAIEVRDAIARGQIKVVRTPTFARDALSAEIGVEMAALLREAEGKNGVVIRPSPVNKIGLEERAEADMSSHLNHLCDMHALLRTMGDLGVVDREAETSAKRYFDLQDRGWTATAAVAPSTPVFLDGLSIVYLQYTNLLQTFLRTFQNVFIHSSTEEEANVLIEYDRDASEVLQVVDNVRNAIRQAHAKGRVTFGPRRAETGDGDSDGMQSTLNLLSNLMGAEAVVFDDRALNKEATATDETGYRARMCSTLDLLEELATRKLLDEEQYRHMRYRLRAAGALLVPVNADEIALAVRRNRRNESPEFRAIRDCFELARISEMPQFPGEMRWFMSYVQGTRSAIMGVWTDEPVEDRARALSSQIFDLTPLPENWVGRWLDQPPPNWVKAVRRALIGGLAMPVEIADRDKIEPYQRWFEEQFMSDLRDLFPDAYQQVIDYLRDFILMPWENDDDDRPE